MLDELAAGAFPIAPTWGVGAESLGEVVTESEGGPEVLLRVEGAMAPRQLWGELRLITYMSGIPTRRYYLDM